MSHRFSNRKEAGQALASRLAHYSDAEKVLVLGLPRGGVPVAYEVARAIHAPLDVFLVRKLGVPGQEELALGAVASGGTVVLNDSLVRTLHLTPSELQEVEDREMQELRRRDALYRGDRPHPNLEDRTAILVDDGLATGATMRAAAEALRLHDPAKVVIAVPVAPLSTCREMEAVADEVIAVETPEPFHAVGLWYEDFTQTTDDEVREILDRAKTLEPAGAQFRQAS